METFKILKLRQPISLYEKYNISSRKLTLLINSFPSKNFFDRSTSLWNEIAPSFKLEDYSVKIGYIKNQLKQALLVNQHRENPQNWTEDDYNNNKICPKI